MSDGPVGGGNENAETGALVLESQVTECGDLAVGAVHPALGTGGHPPAAVELAYVTEGRGAVDEAVVDTTELTGAGPQDFELRVPRQGPISFEGTLMAVRWEVRMVSAGGRDGQVLERAPITVLPSGGLTMWARDAADPPLA